ncbi:conserved hypothetical protein [Sporisorium reilianum SRZ2]|uniref:Uncharacterized protein n=1 Tax=Sporisorium reilianum (strain SRZ2) TaxID=999809 RepID=E6ZMH7_SPORE|nr:conserved hypothetical protein [Sporisorium reilianum SRZ2]
MAATPPAPSSSSSTKPAPTNKTQTPCFPTSSRTAHDGAAPSHSLEASDFYRSLGIIPRSEKNTLSVPLTLSHMLWSVESDKMDTISKPLPRGHTSSTQPQQSSGLKNAASCTPSSSTTTPFSMPHPRRLLAPRLTKIGSAFSRCFHEMRYFVEWDAANFCLSVDASCQSFVDDKLREFGYYEDANGDYQDLWAPKYSSFTTCQHGHRTSKDASTTPSTTSTSATTNKSSATAKHSSPLHSSTSKTLYSGSKKSVATPTIATTPASACKPSCSLASKQNTPATANPATKPAACPATKSTSAADNSTATATASATSSARRLAKKPEQIQSPSLLSDCRRFASFAESNAEVRRHLSHDAPLVEVLRALNRAVLRFGVNNGDNLVWAELGGLIALLNYAAAFYIDVADQVETHMQDKLGNDVVDEYFALIYGTRAECIEIEEYCSEGCPGGEKGSVKQRVKRRTDLLDSFNNIVPDVTDLRDGVQTVLFTFIWINETAYKGYDAAMTATLHNVIPLLQTVVVRCAHQAHFTLRALTAAIDAPQAADFRKPKPWAVQLDLLVFSAALQNLSGCDLALFTSSGSESTRKGRKSKRGWSESLVSCPGALHLYTIAVADMAFDLLQALTAASRTAPVRQVANKCADGCTCHKNEEMAVRIIATLHKRLALIERKQFDWRPQLRAKKSRGNGVAGQRTKSTGGGGDGLVLADVLRDKIAEFESGVLMDRLGDMSFVDYCKAAMNGDTASAAKVATPAKPASAATSAPTPKPPTPKNVVTATTPVKPPTTTTITMTSTAPPPAPAAATPTLSSMTSTFRTVFQQSESSDVRAGVYADFAGCDVQRVQAALGALYDPAPPRPAMSADEVEAWTRAGREMLMRALSERAV